MNTIKITPYTGIKLLLLALVLFCAKANAQVVPFGFLHSNNTPKVGDYRDGGVVFYVAPTPTDLDGDGTLDQGLVCTVDDQSSNAEWGCYETSISGADGTAIGDGADNTIAILAGCNEANIAAKICKDYSVDGYNDWFLPSKAELNLMYQNKEDIGGFASAYYWSSTENSSINAWLQIFDDGSQDGNDKNYSLRVRAVRAF